MAGKKSSDEAAKRARLGQLKAKLKSEVSGFEASHPVLVETANEICSLLSSLGI